MKATMTALAAALIAIFSFSMLVAGQLGQRRDDVLLQRFEILAGYRRLRHRDEPEAVPEELRVSPEDLPEAPFRAVPHHGLPHPPAAYYAQQPPLARNGEAVDDERSAGGRPAVADGAREIPATAHAYGPREAEVSFVVSGQGRVIPSGACVPSPGGD